MIPPLTKEKFINVKKSKSDLSQLLIMTVGAVWIIWGFVDSDSVLIPWLYSMTCLLLLAAISCPVGGAVTILGPSLIKKTKK